MISKIAEEYFVKCWKNDKTEPCPICGGKVRINTGSCGNRLIFSCESCNFWFGIAPSGRECEGRLYSEI